MSKKTEDQKVDGPRAAAAILNQMKGSTKNRLVKAIGEQNPELAKKIEENLFRFDDIINLTPKGVQVLTQEVDHHDLVLSLKTASSEVKTLLFENMSQRKAQMVQEDFDLLPAIRLAEIEGAQKRILQRLDELRAAGKITTQGTNDVWV